MNDFPQGLGSLVTNSLRGLGLEARIKEHACILVWDEVVGEQMASAAQPDYIRDGRMFVVTKSPVWAQELTMYKRDIIARLNRRVGGDVLKDIVFTAGRVGRRRKQKSAEKPERPELEGIRLTDEELERVEAMAGPADREAREDVKSLLMTALRLEKWKAANGWTPCRSCGALQSSPSGVCPVCKVEEKV